MARALVFATLAAAAVSAAPLAAAASKGAPCTKPRVIHSLPKGFAGSFYVSLAGNDSFSGTLPTPSADGSDGPFLTPGAAAAAVQTLPRPFTSDVRVQLRGGVYPLATTLTLGPGSGGDGMDAKVRWSSYDADGPGSAVISGGVALTGWQQTATAGVWVAPLPSAAADRSRGLFVRGERRWPARVPAATGPARSDWASDASTLHYVDTLDGCGFHPSTCFGTCGNASHAINDWGVVYNSSDSRGPSPAWVDIPGIDMLSFAAWTAAWAPLAAIVAHNTTILTAAPLSSARPGAFGGLGCPSGARYILWNVYEALAPGSFYINDTSRTIMYSLLPGEDPAALDAVVPVLPTVVRVQGDDCGGPVAWLSIEGLNISYAAEMSRVTSHSSTGAVTLSSATDVALTHLDISACDGSGVLLLDVLTRLVVDHCSVRDVGGDGFGIDFGRSYQSTNTTIRDSVIDGVGFIFLNQPGGIRIMGDPSGVAVIEHNLVRDSPYAGIMVGWQDGATRPPEPVAWQFIVRANVVEAIGNEVLSDFGGIYISTSGEQCEGTESCYLPTLVEGNLVRDVRGYNYGGEVRQGGRRGRKVVALCSAVLLSATALCALELESAATASASRQRSARCAPRHWGHRTCARERAYKRAHAG